MNPKLHTALRTTAASLATMMIASCSLPSQQAWRQIQRQGLIPFMMGDGQPLSISSKSQAPSQGPVTPRLYATAPTTSPSVIGPRLPSPPPPSMMNSASMPVASSVADLPGYVRSPFTNPPRLVDVRGMSAGSKVVCPYTQKPFLVPGGVSTASSAPKIAAAPAPRVTTPERPRTTPVKPNTDVAALTKPEPSAPVVPPTPPPAPQVKSEAPELPYGSAITGRPGFVNSPYAAKHQLVDVTGLPVGMEVKCPYTGKLFRVPPQ